MEAKGREAKGREGRGREGKGKLPQDNNPLIFTQSLSSPPSPKTPNHRIGGQKKQQCRIPEMERNLVNPNTEKGPVS